MSKAACVTNRVKDRPTTYSMNLLSISMRMLPTVTTLKLTTILYLKSKRSLRKKAKSINPSTKTSLKNNLKIIYHHMLKKKIKTQMKGIKRKRNRVRKMNRSRLGLRNHLEKNLFNSMINPSPLKQKPFHQTFSKKIHLKSLITLKSSLEKKKII